MQRYKLARKGDRIPMPERGPGVFFSAASEGETLDPMNPWHAKIIADGSVVAIPDEEPAKPDHAKIGAK
jgi:hypothetical protein